jgi:hypothetical protein
MQSTLFDHDTPPGKTFQEFSRRETMLSAACWEDLSVLMRQSKLMTRADGEPDRKAGTSRGQVRVWLMDPSEQPAGASWMPNISDWPNDARVCSLFSVLEPAESIPRKYFLSGIACAGILRRAEKRGKALPEALRLALAEVAGSERTSIVTADSCQISHRHSKGELAEAEEITSLPAVDLCLNGGEMNRLDAASETLITHALRGEGFDASEDGTGRGTPLVPVAFDTTQITSASNGSNPQPGDPCHSLTHQGHPPAIAFNLRGREGGAMPEPTDVASLRSASGGSSRTYVGVRRLMPVECERLQGLAGDYTAIEYNGKPAKDGPRYKAIGNSMAAPVLSWILRRINDGKRLG